MKLRRVFKVRIIYKSGATQEAEFLKFNIKQGEYSWQSANTRSAPLILGVEEIAAIWQIGYRWKLYWKAPLES